MSMVDMISLYDTLGIWGVVPDGEEEKYHENDDDDWVRDFAPTTFFETSSPPSGNYSIFYNVFIGLESSTIIGDLKYTLEVIREQTDQIAKAFPPPNDDDDFHPNNSSSSPTIYYNLIGKYMRKLPASSSLDLRRMSYYPKGGEELTLQSMWDYCQVYPAHTVTYLHDKGSLSKNLANALTRRVLTTAVLSEECRRMSDLQCNICTYNFYMIPNAMAPGNMFTASCGLIRSMISPKDWYQKRQEMFQYLMANKNTTDLRFPCFRKHIEDAFENDTHKFNETYDMEWTKLLAMGRYANEVWAWRHPDLQPCVLVQEHEPSLSSVIPLEDSLDVTFPKGAALRRFSKRWVQRASGKQKLSWFQAPGRFWETEYLYNTTLPGDHPFYSVFARRLRPKSRPQC